MTKCKDLADKRFGKLIVIKRVENNKGGMARWLCKCDCGNELVVFSANLLSNHTQSCGCFQKERTGETHKTHNLYFDKEHKITKLYVAWTSMKRRCYNSKSGNYKYYGGRGIKVCDEWLHDYKTFHDWAINNGYQDGLSIERKDVDGNYEPDNCCWITLLQQSRNKRNNIKATYKGETKTLIEWGELLNIKTEVLALRLKRGWSVERAFNQPLRGGKM